MRVSPNNGLRSSKIAKGNAMVPRERLREMLDRVGMSPTDAAKAAGYSDRSGLNKYLDKKQHGDKPIPWSCVKRLIPVLQGQGNPAITLDDLVDISTSRGKAGSRLAHAIHRVQATEDFAGVNAGTLLPIVARAEHDVYVHVDKKSKSYGRSRIAVSPEYPVTSQGVVLAVDAVAGRYEAGTQLHVVLMSEFGSTDLSGRYAVALVPTEGAQLREVSIVRIGRDMSDGLYSAMTTAGTPVSSDSLRWVIVGSYRKE
jgi:hypothetical protein